MQNLLSAVSVRLEAEEYTAVLSNIDLLLKAGFEIEDFGDGTVLVRAVPAMLSGEDVASMVREAAASLVSTGNVDIERIEDIFHSVSCKAAIKAGYITSNAELLELAKKVLNSDDIRYCPHGRPTCFEIKKKDIEKQFGRIQ
jgi:DNA mismatch repair protein MutL